MKTEEKNTLKILVYLGFFILLIVFLRFETNNNKPVKTEENKNDLSFIDKIEINNYSLQVQAILKDDAVTLLYEKQKDIFIGKKIYHGEETEFVKYNKEYYVLENEEFIKNSEFVSFNYDKTFITLDNIKKLFNLKHTVMNDGSIIEVKYKLNDVINLYNEINNTRLYTLDEKDFYIYLKMDEKTVEYFVVDMTPLYKLINAELNTDVVYKIKVKNEKETDTSLIITKLK